MKSESGWVENKGNDPLSSRAVGLTIYSLKVSTDPEAASNWTCLMKVWITKKTVTLGSRSQVGFQAIGRNLCEAGSLFWRARGGRQGTGPGALVGGGGAEQCLSIPYHPVSRAKRIISVCVNARILLPFCFSVSELITPTQSDKFQKLFFWNAAIRQPLRVYSKTLSNARVNVSGWPSGLRRQTQAFASRLWGFWSPNGGVGSNPTSDTPSFCSYDVQMFPGPDRYSKVRITRSKNPGILSESCGGNLQYGLLRSPPPRKKVS